MKPFAHRFLVCIALATACSLGSSRVGAEQANELDTPPKYGKWGYVLVDKERSKWGDWDEPKSLRYFGFDTLPSDREGYRDIVSGRYYYRNPGGDMSGDWDRIDFGKNVDAMLVVDVDNDEHADVIAQALPDVYWLEAEDNSRSSWRIQSVAELPPTTHHVNGQGYRLAQIIPGGKPELLFSTSEGVYYIVIPSDPAKRPWETVRITQGTMDEGIGVGDFDRDGDIDIASATEHKERVSYSIAWYANPGEGGGEWVEHPISTDAMIPDCIEAADFNGDGRLDIAVAEERGGRDGPTAQAYWYEQPAELSDDAPWNKHVLVTAYSLNNLGVGDLDNDGDMDLLTSELKPPKRLFFCRNDGSGNFDRLLIDEGKDMHLGCRCIDLDGDGDLDISGPTWLEHKFLHLWRNDTIVAP